MLHPQASEDALKAAVSKQKEGDITAVSLEKDLKREGTSMLCFVGQWPGGTTGNRWLIAGGFVFWGEEEGVCEGIFCFGSAGETAFSFSPAMVCSK